MIAELPFESRDRELIAGTSDLYGPFPVYETPTYNTCFGDLAGPRAMKATVDAVALLATTDSLAGVSYDETSSNLWTEHIPWNKLPQVISLDCA